MREERRGNETTQRSEQPVGAPTASLVRRSPNDPARTDRSPESDSRHRRRTLNTSFLEDLQEQVEQCDLAIARGQAHAHAHAHGAAGRAPRFTPGEVPALPVRADGRVTR
ncbi:hypothetical protein GCM10027168_10940 [Streptomyces capparidis]